MKKIYLLTMLCMFIGLFANAQQDVFSRSEIATGDWGSGLLPWYYVTSNNSQGDPDNNNTQRNYVKIGHNNNTTMTTNGRFYQFLTLDFQAGASSVRTINNTGGGLSASVGIYNFSTATHIFNTPIGIDGDTVQLHVHSTGGFTFSDNIFINANTVEFGGTGTGDILVTGTMSGTGNVTKTGSNSLTISGSNTYSGTTTVTAGTLVLNSSLSSSAVSVGATGTLQISENATISSLTVADGGIVIVDAGKSLTITNDLVNNGTSFTLNDSASLIVNGTSTGNVTYNRNLGTSNWYLVSSPVSGQAYNAGYVTANGIASGTEDPTNRGIATYTTSTDMWSFLKGDDSNAGTFNNGQGYSVKRTSLGNISFTGLLNTSNVTPTVSTDGNKYNLLGNPYPSHLNFATFLTSNSTNLESTIWVWNQSGGGNYETYVSGVDVFVLAPTQGFFVKAINNTTVTFDKNDQLSSGGTFQKSSNTLIKLMMNDGTADRFAKMYYLNNVTKGFDNGYDGETFGGIPNSVDVFTNLLENNQGKKYQVQSLPLSEMETMIVPVGVKAAAGKEITFTAEATNLPTDVKVFLEDRLTNTVTRLDEANTSYKVTLSDATDGTGRFFLHTNASGVLSTNDVVLQNASVYATSNNTLKVVGLPSGNANLKIFSILGKQVMQTSFSSTGVKEISLPKLSTGMYIIQLETAAGKLNKKIVLE